MKAMATTAMYDVTTRELEDKCAELAEYEESLREREQQLMKQMAHFMEIQQRFYENRHKTGVRSTEDAWEEEEVIGEGDVHSRQPREEDTTKLFINKPLIQPSATFQPLDYMKAIDAILCRIKDKHGVFIKSTSKTTKHSVFVLFLYYINRPRQFYNKSWGMEPRKTFSSTAEINEYCKNNRQLLHDFFEHINSNGKRQRSRHTIIKEFLSKRNIIARYTSSIVF